jgi:hypothetical protein
MGWQANILPYVPPNLVEETGKGIKKPTRDIMAYSLQRPFDSIYKPPALPVRIEKVLPLQRDH